MSAKQTRNTERTYFAVPDPNTGDMTYWFRDRTGRITHWPPKTGRYGPTIPDCSGLSWTERNTRMREWITTVSIPWQEAIEAAIATDPGLAAARFAAFQSRCCICGRTLTDAESKVTGIGPDCRSGLSSDALADLVHQMGRLHGQLELAAA